MVSHRCLVLCALVAASPAHADEQPPPPDTFVATAGSGPAPSLEDACRLDVAEDVTCTVKKLKKKPKAKAPYTGFGLIQRKDGGAIHELLGVRTAAGWHVFALLEWGTDYDGKGAVTISSAESKDVVPGGSPELVIAGTRKTSNESSSYQRYGQTDHLLWVCGVGASGAPSCVEVPLGIDRTPSDTDEESTRISFRLKHKFKADGSITRTLKGTWKTAVLHGETLDRADFENTRSFLFP